MNRQRLILFILVIILGVASLWSYSAVPRPKTISTLTNIPGKRAKVATVALAPDKTPRTVDDGTTLNLALIEKEAADFTGYRRNIFKPFFIDEIKMVKLKAVAIKPPPPAPPVAPPPRPIAVLPEVAPLARFIFLGFLKKGSVKTIFLSKDKEILLVKMGDKVAGRYVATDISDQSLTLTVSDTGDTIVIPLLENRPLATIK
jgi:hypothetical protein